jgi:hypothetical protein
MARLAQRGSKVTKQKKSNRKAIKAQISELLISQHGFNPNLRQLENEKL